MKDILVRLSNDMRISLPKQIIALMNLNPNDYVLIQIDDSMRFFSVKRVRIEAE